MEIFYPMNYFFIFLFFIVVSSGDVLKEIHELKQEIQKHITKDEYTHQINQEKENFLLKENQKLRIQIENLKKKMKVHFKKDSNLHLQIEKEDDKDDEELIHLKKENKDLKEKIIEILSKFQKHISIDTKKHQDFETHIQEEEATFFTSIIRAFVTLLTGAGLGVMIHSTPNFILKLFEWRIFRFLMLVLLAWQGGGGYNLIVSIIGSFLFLLVLNIFDYLN